MNTKQLVSGVLGAGVTAAGLYAGKIARKKIDLGIDPMLQDGLHIVVGAVVLPMLAKGKASDSIKQFGAAIAGEAALNIINGYLPDDYKVSGTDNSGYALGYSQGYAQAMAGTDNSNFALAGTFPAETASSQPVRMAG